MDLVPAEQHLGGQQRPVGRTHDQDIVSRRHANLVLIAGSENERGGGHRWAVAAQERNAIEVAICMQSGPSQEAIAVQRRTPLAAPDGAAMARLSAEPFDDARDQESLPPPPELDPNGDQDGCRCRRRRCGGRSCWLRRSFPARRGLFAPSERPSWRATSSLDFLAPDFFAPRLLRAALLCRGLLLFARRGSLLAAFRFLGLRLRFPLLRHDRSPDGFGQPQHSCRHSSALCLQCRRHSAPGRPVDQLDRVDHRDDRARCDLRDAADIAGCDHIGLRSSRYSRLCARATSSRCPAAECCRCRPSRSTDVPPAHRCTTKPSSESSSFGCACDFLPVLQRAGGMIGDDEPCGIALRRKVELREIFTDVLGERRDARRCAGVERIVAQHEAVVLDRGAAARSGDQDGVEPAARRAPRSRHRCCGAPAASASSLAAQVMDDAAAAALPVRQHDLDAVAGEHADRRLVDRRRRAPA